MDEEDILEAIRDRGLEVDMGNLIGGPFIPDGRVRIYEPESIYSILSEGKTLEEAFEGLP